MLLTQTTLVGWIDFSTIATDLQFTSLAHSKKTKIWEILSKQIIIIQQNQLIILLIGVSIFSFAILLLITIFFLQDLHLLSNPSLLPLFALNSVAPIKKLVYLNWDYFYHGNKEIKILYSYFVLY